MKNLIFGIAALAALAVFALQPAAYAADSDLPIPGGPQINMPNHPQTKVDVKGGGPINNSSKSSTGPITVNVQVTNSVGPAASACPAGGCRPRVSANPCPPPVRCDPSQTVTPHPLQDYDHWFSAINPKTGNCVWVHPGHVAGFVPFGQGYN